MAILANKNALRGPFSGMDRRGDGADVDAPGADFSDISTSRAEVRVKPMPLDRQRDGRMLVSCAIVDIPARIGPVRVAARVIADRTGLRLGMGPRQGCAATGLRASLALTLQGASLKRPGSG